MNDLKESFKISEGPDIQEIVTRAGEKLGWNPVLIQSDKVEFRYSRHLTKFYTIVSWSTEGNINIASNYIKKSIKFDIGNYCGLSNQKIKLAINHEIGLKNEVNKNPEKEDTSFDTQITEVNENQNRFIKKIVFIGAVLLVSVVIYNSFIKEDLCGCEEDDIARLSKTMFKTRAEAIEICCELKRAADKYIK